MNTKPIFSIASIFSFLFSLAVLAQDDEPIVIDDLSVGELRAEIEKIENEFFRVFNLSIDQDHLKVECGDYTPTGSHIRQRACEPAFLVEARNENIIDWQNGVDGLATSEELRAGLSAEFEELTAAMNEVLASNEYFRELNVILRMLRERMEEIE